VQVTHRPRRSPRRPGRRLASTPGFTLTELAIVLSIVAVLAAIAAPSYVAYTQRATIKRVIVDIRNLDVRIQTYRNEFGRAPQDLTDAIRPVPLDPWGRPYQYLAIEGAPPDVMGRTRKDKNLVPLNSDFDLYSKGPDGDSVPALTARVSQDDIVRANDGAFIGVAADY
jgi:general secretion pathway protein G